MAVSGRAGGRRRKGRRAQRLVVHCARLAATGAARQAGVALRGRQAGGGALEGGRSWVQTLKAAWLAGRAGWAVVVQAQRRAVRRQPRGCRCGAAAGKVWGRGALLARMQQAGLRSVIRSCAGTGPRLRCARRPGGDAAAAARLLARRVTRSCRRRLRPTSSRPQSGAACAAPWRPGSSAWSGGRPRARVTGGARAHGGRRSLHAMPHAPHA